MAKIKNTPVNRQQVEKKEELSELDVKRFILSKPDELVDKKGSDESLDELLEKTALIRRTKHPHIIGERLPYVVKFPMEFYRQIFRLWGWKADSNDCFRKKPGVVAKITVYLIYLRFPKGVLRELQSANKKNKEGKRLFKHFQWFTPEGERLLKQFIAEAITLMRESDNWNQFIRVFTQRYSNPYGLAWDEL